MEISIFEDVGPQRWGRVIERSRLFIVDELDLGNTVGDLKRAIEQRRPVAPVDQLLYLIRPGNNLVWLNDNDMTLDHFNLGVAADILFINTLLGCSDECIMLAPGGKVSVIGVGQVGMACAFSMLLQHTVRELCLVDVDADKVKREILDVQHGLAFIRNCTVKGDTDYEITAGSNICVITAGARQREGESCLQLLNRNVDNFRGIIPNLVKYSLDTIILVVSNPDYGITAGSNICVITAGALQSEGESSCQLLNGNVEIFRCIIANLVKYSPDTIIVVVSNPVDVVTYVTWKMSGLPKERVLASGTGLDSARLRFLMSEKFNVAPTSCHGWIIGEHGDSSALTKS